jgi:hypothetical protein
MNSRFVVVVLYVSAFNAETRSREAKSAAEKELTFLQQQWNSLAQLTSVTRQSAAASCEMDCWDTAESPPSPARTAPSSPALSAASAFGSEGSDYLREEESSFDSLHLSDYESGDAADA